MSIREEVLVGKILYEYYLLPEKQRVNSSFITIRRSIAKYYLGDHRKVKDFIHRFREIKDEMKIKKEDGKTNMRFVMDLLDLDKKSKEISNKLDERDVFLSNLKSQNISNFEKNKEPYPIKNKNRTQMRFFYFLFKCVDFYASWADYLVPHFVSGLDDLGYRMILAIFICINILDGFMNIVIEYYTDIIYL